MTGAVKAFSCEQMLIESKHLPADYTRSRVALNDLIQRLNQKEMELEPYYLTVSDALARGLARAALASMPDEVRTTSTNPPESYL